MLTHHSRVMRLSHTPRLAHAIRTHPLTLSAITLTRKQDPAYFNFSRLLLKVPEHTWCVCENRV
jgi:hypothetical protein